MLEVNSTDGILIPTGTTAERPSGRKGIVRYNSQLERYEGYGAGDAWGSLGGVVDIDQDTYITAERLGILDEDHLWMYTKGDLRMIIRDNGNEYDLNLDNNSGDSINDGFLDPGDVLIVIRKLKDNYVTRIMIFFNVSLIIYNL